MTIEWVETRYCRLALGDCRELLPTLAAGSVDAVVTDPPYGIAYRHGYVSAKNTKWETKHHNVKIIGDRQKFDPSPWLKFDRCILWGANYFCDRLPPGGWLVWDKRPGLEDMEFSMSDAELAFEKGATRVQTFRYLWHGLCRAGEIGEHFHPTQKPIELMQWCIERSSDEGQTIIDPFMGSGTTGVACVRTGRRFIGCEIDPKYFQIALKRIREEEAKPDLFAAYKEQPKAKAGDLFASLKES